MKILIIEDEAIHADRFEMLAEQLNYEVVGVCDNGFDSIDCFHRTSPDIVIVDINLIGEIDGVEVAKRINQAKSVPIVFVTSLKDDETFKRVQEIKPAAFLLKPFDLLQLQRAVELAVSKLSISESIEDKNQQIKEGILQDCLFVKVREKLEKLRFEDILYIESDGRHCLIYTIDNHKFIVRIPINELEQKLPAKDFIKSHRSYLINLKWLQRIDNQEMVVYIKDRAVPLSKSHRQLIVEKLNQV